MHSKLRTPKTGNLQHGLRASITFPSDVYRTLERIAKEKKVSVAWVVRDAAEKYIEARWPLLGKQ